MRTRTTPLHIGWLLSRQLVVANVPAKYGEEADEEWVRNSGVILMRSSHRAAPRAMRPGFQVVKAQFLKSGKRGQMSMASWWCSSSC